MTAWVCKQDGVVFTVGAAACPVCSTRDAFEQGGDKRLNVYDAVEVTGIGSPGRAWGLVNEAVAVAIHEQKMDRHEVPLTHSDGVAQLMSGEGRAEAEVSERLGLLPDDSGAAGTEVIEESGESAGSEPAKKRPSKDVPS